MRLLKQSITVLYGTCAVPKVAPAQFCSLTQLTASESVTRAMSLLHNPVSCQIFFESVVILSTSRTRSLGRQPAKDVRVEKMDTRQLIDDQFDRAVEIVQGLPKTGPIQTGYEEKLTMYRCVVCNSVHPQHRDDIRVSCYKSLYKQGAQPPLCRSSHFWCIQLYFFSNCRKRQNATPRNVGHAWSSKMVSVNSYTSHTSISFHSARKG
jgi:hypothetical protein